MKSIPKLLGALACCALSWAAIADDGVALRAVVATERALPAATRLPRAAFLDANPLRSVQLSPDGRHVVTIDASQEPFICSVDGVTPARPVPGAEVGDLPVHWPKEDEIYVCRRDSKKSDIYAIDLTTGARRFVRTMRPPDAAGVEGVFPILYAGGGDHYVFGYKLLLTSLFVVSGLR